MFANNKRINEHLAAVINPGSIQSGVKHENQL